MADRIENWHAAVTTTMEVHKLAVAEKTSEDLIHPIGFAVVGSMYEASELTRQMQSRRKLQHPLPEVTEPEVENPMLQLLSTNRRALRQLRADVTPDTPDALAQDGSHMLRVLTSAYRYLGATAGRGLVGVIPNKSGEAMDVSHAHGFTRELVWVMTDYPGLMLTSGQWAEILSERSGGTVHGFSVANEINELYRYGLGRRGVLSFEGNTVGSALRDPQPGTEFDHVPDVSDIISPPSRVVAMGAPRPKAEVANTSSNGRSGSQIESKAVNVGEDVAPVRAEPVAASAALLRRSTGEPAMVRAGRRPQEAPATLPPETLPEAGPGGPYWKQGKLGELASQLAAIARPRKGDAS